MTLTTTPGSSTADSYVSVIDATLYLRERHVVPDWEAATQVSLEQVLRQATGLLDELTTWEGALTSTTQALSWPRTGVSDREGREIDDATIPSWLERACAEYANILLIAAQESTGLQGVRSISVDGASLSFDAGGNVAPTDGLPSSIARLVRPYGYVAGYGRVKAVRS